MQVADQIKPAEKTPENLNNGEPAQEADRLPGRREWLRQVDFWENVKDFILRRIPPGSRPIDQLY